MVVLRFMVGFLGFGFLVGVSRHRFWCVCVVLGVLDHSDLTLWVSLGAFVAVARGVLFWAIWAGFLAVSLYGLLVL